MKTKFGCVHGRFQPFHNEHLDYVLAAKQRCQHLLVGITRYDYQRSHCQKSHRLTLEANPFNYRDRALMIKEALLQAGLSCKEFDITPFPIDNPESLPAFIPYNVTCYTTIREQWNKEKANILKKAGYPVDILWENYDPKQVSGSMIRTLIRQGSEEWKALVPAGAIRAIEQAIIMNPAHWF